MLFGFVKNLTAAAILLPLTVQAAQTIQLDKIRLTVKTYGVQRNSETGLLEQMQLQPLSVDEMSDVMAGAEVTVNTKVKSFNLGKQIAYMTIPFGHAGSGTQTKDKVSSVEAAFEREATALRLTSATAKKSMAIETEANYGAELNIKVTSAKSAELGCESVQKFSISPDTQNITIECLQIQEAPVALALPKAAINVQSLNRINRSKAMYQSYAQIVTQVNQVQPSCEMSFDGNLEELKSSLRANVQACTTKGDCMGMYNAFVAAKNFKFNEYLYGSNEINSQQIPNVTAIMDSRITSAMTYTLRFVKSDGLAAATGTYVYDLNTKEEALVLSGKYCRSKAISLDK